MDETLNAVSWGFGNPFDFCHQINKKMKRARDDNDDDDDDDAVEVVAAINPTKRRRIGQQPSRPIPRDPTPEPEPEPETKTQSPMWKTKLRKKVQDAKPLDVLLAVSSPFRSLSPHHSKIAELRKMTREGTWSSGGLPKWFSYKDISAVVFQRRHAMEPVSELFEDEKQASLVVSSTAQALKTAYQNMLEAKEKLAAEYSTEQDKAYGAYEYQYQLLYAAYQTLTKTEAFSNNYPFYSILFRNNEIWGISKYYLDTISLVASFSPGACTILMNLNFWLLKNVYGVQKCSLVNIGMERGCVCYVTAALANNWTCFRVADADELQEPIEYIASPAACANWSQGVKWDKTFEEWSGQKSLLFVQL
jgi:hypothetical protein